VRFLLDSVHKSLSAMYCEFDVGEFVAVGYGVAPLGIVRVEGVFEHPDSVAVLTDKPDGSGLQTAAVWRVHEMFVVELIGDVVDWPVIAPVEFR